MPRLRESPEWKSQPKLTKELDLGKVTHRPKKENRLGGVDQKSDKISSHTRSKIIRAKGVQLDGCLKKVTSSSRHVRFAAKDQIKLGETQYPTYHPAQLRWSNRHLENNWKYAYKKEKQGTAWWLNPEEFTFEQCYGDLDQPKAA